MKSRNVTHSDITQRWDQIVGALGPETKQKLQLTGLATAEKFRRRRSYARLWAQESEIAVILVVVAVVIGLVWYRHRQMSTEAPDHGGRPYVPPPAPIKYSDVSDTEGGAMPLNGSNKHTPPVIKIADLSQLETRIQVPPLTSGAYQIGPLHGSQTRLVTSSDPWHDEVTDLVTAKNVPQGHKPSLWRFDQAGSGLYYIKSIENGWYMSADVGGPGGWQLRVQEPRERDEEMYVEGPSDAFRISSRKWGQPRYVQVQGGLVTLSEGSGTLLRAFRHSD